MSKAFASLLARRFAPLDFSSVLGFPHPVPDMSEWGDFLPVFREEKDDNPAEHLLKFHECMELLNLQHEDVRMKMFMYSLYGDARKWYFSLPSSSISSLKDFHKAFNQRCKKFFPNELLFDNCCEEFNLHNKAEDEKREGSLHHFSNDLHDTVPFHQDEPQTDDKGTEDSSVNNISDFHQSEEFVSLVIHHKDHSPSEVDEGLVTSEISTVHQRDDPRCLHKDQIASFQNSEYVEQADVSVKDSLKPAINRKDSFQYFDCSTHDKKLKDDEQIESSTVESIRATIDVEGSPYIPDLQKKTNCNRHLQEGQQNGSDQKFSSYVSPAEIPQPTVNRETNEVSQQQFGSQLDQQQGKSSTEISKFACTILESRSADDKEQFIINNEVSLELYSYLHTVEGVSHDNPENMQILSTFQLKQQQEVFSLNFTDPFVYYLKSSSSIDVKLLSPNKGWLCCIFELYISIPWFPTFIFRSKVSLAIQILRWLHWKHDFT
jgi:hypothetical protein